MKFFNSNNTHQETESYSTVPKILTSSSKYNDADNKIEILYIFDTNNETSISNRDLYFDKDNSDPSTPLLPSSYSLLSGDWLGLGRDFIQMTVSSDGNRNDLEFESEYSIKIKDDINYEIKSVYTISEGKLVDHDLMIGYDYDTIWFDGIFIQPTLDHYNNLRWEINNANGSLVSSNDIDILNKGPEQVTNFTKEILASHIDGIYPESEYEIIIVAEEYNGNLGNEIELINETIITDEPPYVDETTESYGFSNDSDSITIDYNFGQPLDINYSALELVINLYDGNNIIQQEKINANANITKGHKILEGTQKDSIVDNKSYNIKGIINYKSNIHPTYVYSEEVFDFSTTTDKRPKPTLIDLPTHGDIFHNSIEREFELTQPNYNGTDKYNAYKVRINIFDTRTNSSVGQEKVLDETIINNGPFLVEYDNLNSNTEYRIEFEYITQLEYSSRNWVKLSNFNFTTIKVPLPIGEIKLINSNPLSVKWGFKYRNTGDQGFYDLLNLRWKIIETTSGSEIGPIDVKNPKPSTNFIEYSSDKLDPKKSYKIIMEYQTLNTQEQDMLKWEEISTLDFSSPKPEQSEYKTISSWAGYDIWGGEWEFKQPSNPLFIINKINWKLTNGRNIKFSGSIIPNSSGSSCFEFNNDSYPHKLDINEEYKLQVWEEYDDPKWNYLSSWKDIDTMKTHNVYMPTIRDIEEVYEHDEITLSFNMFNVHEDWVNNQRDSVNRQSISNNDLYDASFDEVRFTLMEGQTKELIDQKIVFSSEYDYNKLATVSSTFKKLNHSTKYNYKIQVYKNGVLHKFAFNGSTINGSIVTSYKLWFGYILYPLLTLLIVGGLSFIYIDLNKDKQLKRQLLFEIFDNIDELTESLKPYIIPAGISEHEDLMNKDTKYLQEVLEEKNIEYKTSYKKPKLVELITGFTIEDISKAKDKIDFKYKKHEDVYKEILGDYSNVITKERSFINKLVEKHFSKDKEQVNEIKSVKTDPKINKSVQDIEPPTENKEVMDHE